MKHLLVEVLLLPGNQSVHQKRYARAQRASTLPVNSFDLFRTFGKSMIMKTNAKVPNRGANDKEVYCLLKRWPVCGELFLVLLARLMALAREPPRYIYISLSVRT